MGRESYWLLVWGALVTVFLTLKGFVMAALEGTCTWRQTALNVAETILNSKWVG
jgi:hypothetical protein